VQIRNTAIRCGLTELMPALVITAKLIAAINPKKEMIMVAE
jgi:hypothetical protein